jgi:hypothetical protein
LSVCISAFAAQSILAALGSVQFVANVVFASTVLGEKVTPHVSEAISPSPSPALSSPRPPPSPQITWLILLSTLCIIGGCLVLVLFGDHSNVAYTVDQLIALYRESV